AVSTDSTDHSSGAPTLSVSAAWSNPSRDSGTALPANSITLNLTELPGRFSATCQNFPLNRDLHRGFRQRLDRLHHRHQAEAFPHRDVLPEDLFADFGVDARDLGRRQARERFVENRAERLRGDARRILDREVQLQSAVRLLVCPDVRLGLAF